MIFKHCELFLWFFIKYIQNFPYTDFVSWIVLSDTSQVKFFKKRELRPRNVHARSNHEYSRSQNRQKSKYCFWWKEHLSDSCQVRSKLGKITPKKSIEAHEAKILLTKSQCPFCSCKNTSTWEEKHAGFSLSWAWPAEINDVPHHVPLLHFGSFCASTMKGLNK